MGLAGVAAAEAVHDTGNGSAPLLHGTAHCVKGTPGTKSGRVVVHSSAKWNDTRVHVTLLKGVPNATYYVAIACERYIGTLKTNRRGNGTANIKASGATVFPFYVDLGITGTAADYRIAGPFAGHGHQGHQGNQKG